MSIKIIYKKNSNQGQKKLFHEDGMSALHELYHLIS